MRIENYSEKSLEKLLSRSQLNFENLNEQVRAIVAKVKREKDSGVKELNQKFDNYAGTLQVTREEIESAYSEVSPELLGSLKKAKDNIWDYHAKTMRKDVILKEEGKTLGFTLRPMERAGIYVPGGLASYPSSVLMCGVPAKVAGVKEIVMTTPAKNGYVNPLTLVAADIVGVDKIFKIGGATAIAALAFGTETVPKVSVITGPGNIYVTLAKKEVYGNVAIDMIAGPSEILIISDGKTNPKFVAADLLSQAEHDEMSASILLTTSMEFAKAVESELSNQLKVLKKRDIAQKAISENGMIMVCPTIENAIEVANMVAPEHLELLVENPWEHLDKIINAGAVFLGDYSPEPLGDYFAGPNHVLPTSGTAKHFSALSTDTYLKKISIVEYSKEELLKCGEDIVNLATAENLSGHARSVAERLKEENQ